MRNSSELKGELKKPQKNTTMLSPKNAVGSTANRSMLSAREAGGNSNANNTGALSPKHLSTRNSFGKPSRLKAPTAVSPRHVELDGVLNNTAAASNFTQQSSATTPGVPPHRRDSARGKINNLSQQLSASHRASGNMSAKSTPATNISQQNSSNNLLLYNADKFDALLAVTEKERKDNQELIEKLKSQNTALLQEKTALASQIARDNHELELLREQIAHSDRFSEKSANKIQTLDEAKQFMRDGSTKVLELVKILCMVEGTLNSLIIVTARN